MLSGQNYKEFIEEQGQIQKNIAQGWGYELNPYQYVPKREKICTNLKVACIEPLRQIFDMPVSKKLSMVEEELRMLQNQRKLAEITEKAFEAKAKGEIITEQESAAIKMMHQCIEEYNFIVEHRHIVEKNSERARKILGIQKSESKQIFEQIHSLKQQLGKSTLSTTVKINSEIAKLYKKYSQIVPKSLNNSERLTSRQSKSIVNRAYTSTNNSGNTSFVGTSKLSPNKNSVNKNSEVKQSEFKDSRTKKQSMIQIKDLMIMQELNESEEGDSMAQSRLLQEELRMQPQSMLIPHGLAKMQRRVSQYAAPRRRLVTVIDAKQKLKQQKRQRMTTTIEQAYEKKQIIHKGKKLDKIIQDHHDVVDIWKQRINQNKEKNHNFYMKFQAKAKAKKFKSLKNTHRNGPAQTEQKANMQNKFNSTKINYRAEQLKQNLSQKEKIISLILRKKQSKFKRIPGTQILQKNDVNQTAKLFLGIAKHNDSHENNKNQSRQNIVKKEDLDSPEWQKIDANDQKLYWSMCKNQKMNILLKSRKQE